MTAPQPVLSPSSILPPPLSLGALTPAKGKIRKKILKMLFISNFFFVKNFVSEIALLETALIREVSLHGTFQELATTEIQCGTFLVTRPVELQLHHVSLILKQITKGLTLLCQPEWA
jgi:hypothetical protein